MVDTYLSMTPNPIMVGSASRFRLGSSPQLANEDQPGKPGSSNE